MLDSKEMLMNNKYLREKLFEKKEIKKYKLLKWLKSMFSYLESEKCINTFTKKIIKLPEKLILDLNNLKQSKNFKKITEIF